MDNKSLRVDFCLQLLMTESMTRTKKVCDHLEMLLIVSRRKKNFDVELW